MKLLRRNAYAVREALTDKRTYTIYPPPAGYRGGGGVKVCAVSNFIYTGSFFWKGEGDFGFFFIRKGIKGKKCTFTRYVDFFLISKVNF